MGGDGGLTDMIEEEHTLAAGSPVVGTLVGVADNPVGDRLVGAVDRHHHRRRRRIADPERTTSRA